MAYPSRYDRQFDYEGFQDSNPESPLPGDSVNIDLNALVVTTDDVIDFLQISFNADGTLKNDTVGFDQLGEEVETTAAGLAAAVADAVAAADAAEAAQAAAEAAQAAAEAAAALLLRTTLVDNLVLYVRKDGSDANTGLADNASGAKLTVQAAIDEFVDNYDTNGFNTTIQVRVGTYTEVITVHGWIGGGGLTFLGDTSTPANIVLTGGGSGDTFTMGFSGEIVDRVTIDGFEIRAGSGDYGINNQATGHLQIGANMRFGSSASATAHLAVTWRTAQIHTGAYTISGNADRHIDCDAGIIQLDATPTISGSLTFGTFARWRNHGHLICLGSAFSGTVAGKRFSGEENSCANVNGTARTYFPGDSDGTLIAGAVISGSDEALHAPIIVGPAATTRIELKSSGQISSRVDGASVPQCIALHNYGITGVDQGMGIGYTFGAAGVAGSVGVLFQALSTEDWSAGSASSAKGRFSTRTDDTLLAELDIGGAGGLRVRPETAIPAAGATTMGIKFTSTANFGLFVGSGAPTLVAAKGSLYLRSDGSSTSTRLYVASDSAGTWVAVTTAS